MIIGMDGGFLRSKKPTGPEAFARGMLYGLNKLDNKNSYVIFTLDDEAPLPFELNGNFCIKKIYRNSLLPQFYAEQIMFASELRKLKADLMFFPSHKTFLFTKPCKTVSTIFDLGFNFYPDTFEYCRRLKFKIYTKKTVFGSDRIIAISNSTKNDVVSYYGADENKIDVVHLGIDDYLIKTDSGKDSEILLKHKLGDNYLLHLGVFQPRKNINGLLEAFKMLISEKGFRARLVLAGKKGWLCEDTFKMLHNDPIIKDNVTHLGYIDETEKWALLRNAKALIIPSYYEGFGIPAAEAMYCGVPVLCSNASSLPEVAGDAGFYFDPRSPKEICECISKILTDNELHKKLKIKSKERSKLFTWENSAKKLLEVFAELG